MSEFDQSLTTATIQSWEQGIDLVDKLFDVAQPRAIFSEPITAGEQTVITASEVWVAMGFGYGMGGGSAPEMEKGEGEAAAAAETAGAPDMAGATGMGGGGGGGGTSSGRPVAAIAIGPQGIQVEPIVDATKLGLAFITALGGMLMFGRRMRGG